MNESEKSELELSYDPERLGFLDRVTNKIISRKFLVFITATALMCCASLESDTWGMIAIVYIGGQSVIDAAMSWKHGKDD